MLLTRVHYVTLAGRLIVLILLVAGLLMGRATPASAQQNYGQYYQKQFKKTGGGGLGLGSSNRYLYDKYFYHRPTVSPYLSAVRGGDLSGTAYYASVKPELERREAAARNQAAYVQQRKLEGKVGDTRMPGTAFYGASADNAYLKPIPQRTTTPSAYYNHWYGGWANR